MTRLDFTGREFVQNHDLAVPFHPIVRGSVYGDATSADNLVIHADNLFALKALLPVMSNQVDVVYIDPPYNTGKEKWRYNDNVNSPMARQWLEGSPIDAEDMLRHDKWLCLMYPRLKLLRELMAPDGVIFISIDDNELYNLKLVMDELFGEANWVGTIVWKNVTDNNPTNIVTEHEYILCYAKEKSLLPREWKSDESAQRDRLLEAGTELIAAHPGGGQALQAAYTAWFRANKKDLGELDRYKYIDLDGVYTGSQSVHNPNAGGYHYDVAHPATGKPCKLPKNGYRFPESTMKRLADKGRLLFGEDETKIIELKVYAKDFRAKLPSVISLEGRTGSNELAKLFPDHDEKVFDHPKPSALIRQLLSYVPKKDALVLDSFAGSGTTGHAVLALNQEDSGTRRFVLVEGEDYADEVTLERVRRVIEGVPGDDALFAGTGGGVTACTLGAALDAEQMLNGSGLPTFETLGAWLFHTATGHPADPSAFDAETGYLGMSDGTHCWLRYADDLEVLRSTRLALTSSFVEKITNAKDGRHIVFAPGKFLSNQDLKVAGVSFATLPFALYATNH